MNRLIVVLSVLLIVGCASDVYHSGSASSAKVTPSADAAKLSAVLAAQPEETQGRYKYRHPQETMEFFGIAPGMTVMEALPGGGWYTKILLPYLGSDGKVIGVDYAQNMYPLFGFFDDAFIEKKKTWVQDWTKQAQEWRDDNSAELDAFVFESMPDRFEGQADAVLFIRALHNLNRFENDGNFRSKALKDAFRVLKRGGIVGVVQHRVPDSTPDDSSQGNRGYMEQGNLIKSMEAAGFEFVASSEINANPKDQPAADDIVWRLPPTLFTSREDPELRKKMNAIGESDRMTLKFRKP